MPFFPVRSAAVTALLLAPACPLFAGPPPLAAYPGYSGEYDGFTLVLDERFDRLDPDIWNAGDGAVGTESMCRFLPEAVVLENGTLNLIIDRKDVAAGWSENHQKMKPAYDFVCGELRTQPAKRIRYGRIETRMRAPDRGQASGYISSLFTYVNEAAAEGPRRWEEIDVELEGGRPDAFQANLIYGENAEGWSETRRFGAWEHKIDVGAVDRWRVFAIEWLPEHIRWFIDGDLVKTLRAADLDCEPTCIPPQTQPTPIPDQLTDVMMNFWIPNDDIQDVFGGNKNRNHYPMRTRYDWLRIYQYDALPLENWAAP